MVLDHSLDRPGLRTLLQIKGRVEIETVFAFNMRANKGGIGNALALIDDIRQLPLARGRSLRPLLAVRKTGHLQLHSALAHKRPDCRHAAHAATASYAPHLTPPTFL